MSGSEPLIAISIGDHNGIGPEVVLKSILHPRVRRCCTTLLVGSADVLDFYRRKLRLNIKLNVLSEARPGDIPILEPRLYHKPSVRPGLLSAHAGRISGQCIALAVELTQSGLTDAIVTAPVAKKALHLAGLNFPGQTEMLQQLTDSPSVAMMLVSKTMRVGLATIHTPLKNVAKELTGKILKERIRLIHQALVQDWLIRKPRIAVLGLNPHAGEGGDIGNEEIRIIRPVIKSLRSNGFNIEGPFPADAFFARYRPGTVDAIVAMYHDQGLIPLKMSSIGKAVNVSVGLPIIRTSPDHGTAFDIAGKGVADPGSMIEAIMLAVQLATNRKKSLS
ncbi:MAG: 4-hydroxythreonine-4-phosphate dehydrogenase PdxA [Bacteroidota bacterium]